MPQNKSKRRKLKPIEPKASWSVALQKRLASIIREVIYQPLIDSSKTVDKENAKDDAILKAMKAGQLSYVGGSFRAKKWKASWSRELKAMGAKWDKRSASWSLPLMQMPPDLADKVRVEKKKTEKLIRDFNDAIRAMPKRMAEKIEVVDLREYAKKTATKTTKEFEKTVVRPLGVQPHLSPEERIFIDETYIETVTRPIKLELETDYEDNIKQSVAYFTDEETKKLRKMIAEHVMAGRPRNELIDKIDARLDVGDTRAKFIARQETSMFTAQLKQAQYQTAQIEEYEWLTVGDNRVRHDHRLLHGKKFRWDDPPIVDEASGRRAHPGEDFNCRCLASPVVED